MKKEKYVLFRTCQIRLQGYPGPDLELWFRLGWSAEISIEQLIIYVHIKKSFFF